MIENSHGRIYFKPDMKTAVLEGRKTMTSRTTKHKLGLWEAWSGGRRFAWLRITDVVSTNWFAVTADHYREEGFESPTQMRKWADANQLGHYAQAKILFRHTFEVVHE